MPSAKNVKLQMKNPVCYRSEDGIRFGTYLDKKRQEKGITTGELCRGLCSEGFLADIRHGKKNADWHLRSRLLERAGSNGVDHEVYLGYEEFKEWEMQRGILTALEDRDTDRAAKKLDEYAEKYGMSSEGSKAGGESQKDGNITKRLRRQFYLGMRGWCRSLQGGQDSELAVLFGKAVKLTVPDVDTAFLSGRALAQQELDLILEYERYRDSPETIKKYREVLDYLSVNTMEKESRVRIYPKAVWYLCHCLLKQTGNDIGRHMEILKLCNKGIRLLRSTKRTYYLWELLTLQEQAITGIAALWREKGEDQKCGVFSERLADIQKLKKALAALHEQTGAPMERGECCYLYQLQDAYYIGDIVRNRRRMLGITREELCRGICSLDTLRRLENRQKSTRRPIVRKLCRRLGLSAECERTELVTSDPKVYALGREIRDMQFAGQFEQSIPLLAELRTLIDMSHNINQQCVLAWEAAAGYYTGRLGKKEYTDHLKQALEHTLPISAVQFSAVQECYLTNTELRCICQYSRMEEEKDAQEAHRRLEPVCRVQRGFEKAGTEQNHIQSYELFAGYEASLLRELGKYDSSACLAKNVIRQCLRTGRMNMLSRAWYNLLGSSYSGRRDAAPEKAELEWKAGIENCIAISRFCKDTAYENFLNDAEREGA